MKILMVTSEMVPFASTGSMGDRVHRLAGALRALGHEVTVVMPLYRQAREGGAQLRKTRFKFPVTVGSSRFVCQVSEAMTKSGIRVLFVGRDEFFDRSGLYGHEGVEYQDNAARFIFFVKAALELVGPMQLAPDVIHAHGWQAALVGVFAKHSIGGIPVVLSPHNLEYQGNFWSYDFGLTNLSGEYFSSSGLEFYGSMNFLKAGLLFSERIVLPDERMAAAVQTPAAGCGLENVLREQAGKIWGIPDGASIDGWDPQGDDALVSTYGPESPIRRQPNREVLRKQFGWPPEGVTFAVSAGISDVGSAFFDALDRLLSERVSLVFLGPVSERDRPLFEIARRRHASRFVARDVWTEVEVRRILAGSDFLLVPDQTAEAQPWLPRALRYGMVPVVRQCPGLLQFVEEFSDQRGNGFLFWSEGSDALVDGCRKALQCATSTGLPDSLVAASMLRDFSDAASASAHEELYSQISKIVG